jgi:hypothetical protein
MQFAAMARALKNLKLMAKSQDLRVERRPSSKSLPNGRKEREDNREHTACKPQQQASEFN